MTYEVDNSELNTQPTAVDDIIFPVDVGKGNGVDVVVEEQSQVDKQKHDCHSSGTNLVGNCFLKNVRYRRL